MELDEIDQAKLRARNVVEKKRKLFTVNKMDVYFII